MRVATAQIELRLIAPPGDRLAAGTCQRENRSMRRLVIGLGCAICTALAPATASAHFYIDYPDAGFHPGPSPVPWWNQDALGSPQKLGPCGDEDDATDAGGGPTNVVTPYAPGQTVTLQWTEVISHAGWFRIALAADRSAFVDPPIRALLVRRRRSS